MTIKTPAVVVGATPTLLSAGEHDLDAGHSIQVTIPSGGVTVYVGGPDVGIAGSDTEGKTLLAGWEHTVKCDPAEALYGIVATATQRVTTFQRGL